MKGASRPSGLPSQSRVQPVPCIRPVSYTHLSLQATDLGSIPQSLDAVQIGAADRMRFSAPRTVFILGANEGIFPAYPTQNGLLSDRERQQLIELGLPLAEPSEQQTVEERFFAYMALSAPSERLYVSYRCSNAAGETLTPSLLAETAVSYTHLAVQPASCIAICTVSGSGLAGRPSRLP